MPYRQHTTLGVAKFTRFRSTEQILKDLLAYKKIPRGLGVKPISSSLPHGVSNTSITTGINIYILTYFCTCYSYPGLQIKNKGCHSSI